MDFFARQDRTRRNSRLLVAYFVAAVLLIIAATDLTAVGLVRITVAWEQAHAAIDRPDGIAIEAPNRAGQDDLEAVVVATIATLLIIGSGCVYRIRQFARGGRAVAEMMGATPVPSDPADPRWRTLRDVVEEMAIASGIPAPAVWVMTGEPRINAFAAGFTPADSVLCVTQGCLDRLTRDELQGVVAHEFSHILNGDVNLDLRLAGALNGILLIGLLGYGLLRTAPQEGGGDGDSFLAGLILLLGGCALMAIGFIGLFFGRLIQSAVCRQRESLADASAVQFTRNPSGLAGALKKLGARGSAGALRNPAAERIAHMFFAGSMGMEAGWMATHPPVAERIRLLEPAWDGKFPPPPAGSTTLERYGGNSGIHIPAPRRAPVAAAAIVGSIGRPMPAHIQWASDFLTSIPADIDRAAREPFGARALVLAMLLSSNPSVRAEQWNAAARTTDPPTLDAARKLLPSVDALGSRARRVLLDLTIPALRQLSGPQSDEFRRLVAALIAAGGELTPFEFLLRRILSAAVIDTAALPGRSRQIYFAIKPLLPDVETILSVLARADGKEEKAVADSFATGAARIEADRPLSFVPSVKLPELDAALDRFAQSSPGVKRRLINACAFCVAADGMVQTEEGELLRAIVAALDCPLPPLLANHAMIRPDAVLERATTV